MKEIALRGDYLRNEIIETIYFGGGTPSLLSQPQLMRIMDHIARYYQIAENAEITFEANPDDIDPVKLQDWKRAGINRLSIGVQSFFEEDLQWMNRAHTAQQAQTVIRMAQQEGLGNISIDLIFGTPALSDDKWQHNLDTAIGSGVPHLSCYALTVEPGTALDTMIRKKKTATVNNDDQARQFLMMTDALQSHGYEHYEISNFAVPGKRSRHNSAYWNGARYIGLGPSAHSFNGSSRQWNIANNALYIQSLLKNELLFEMETLSSEQHFNEYIMTSLRTAEGTDIHYIKNKFGAAYTDGLLPSIKGLVEKGWVENIPDKLVLTREGKLFADGIASELFRI